MDCSKIIQNIWITQNFGSPMHVLNTKLKMLKVELKIWSKTSFVNDLDHVSVANANMNNIKSKLNDQGPSETPLNCERHAKFFLEEAFFLEEMFW